MNFSKSKISLIPDKLEEGQVLWSVKHTKESLEIIKKDKRVYYGQYQQRPYITGGALFKTKDFKLYELLPPDVHLVRIYCDTAQKEKEINDYSVFQCWGYSPSKGIFLLDLMRGKYRATVLETKLVAFWNKHKPDAGKPFGAELVKVEDKSSGSSLIQTIEDNYFIPIEPIQRHRDKFFRVMGVINYVEQGYVHLPKNAEFLNDYLDEFEKFTPTMTHKYDDQIDPTVDAIEDLLVNKNILYSSENLGN